MKRTRSFLDSGLPILAGAFGTQAAVLVTGILSARLLGVQGRGLFSLSTLIPSLLALLTGLSTPQLANLLVAQGFGGQQVLARVYRAARWFIGIGAGSSILATWFLTKSWALGLIAGVALPCLILVGICTGLTRGGGRYWRSALLQLSSPILFAGFLGAGVTLFVPTPELAFIAWVMSLIMSATFGLLVARDLVGSSVNARLPSAREIRTRGIRSLITTYAPLESLRLDQLLVSICLGASALGLYVSGIAFSNLGRLLGQALSGSVSRVVAANGPNLRRTLRLYWLCAGGFGLLVACVAPFGVVLAFGPEFTHAAILSIPLCIGGAFMASRTVLTEIARALQVESTASRAELVATMVYLPLFALALYTPDRLFAASVTLAIATGVSLALTVYVLRNPLRAAKASL